MYSVATDVTKSQQEMNDIMNEYLDKMVLMQTTKMEWTLKRMLLDYPPKQYIEDIIDAHQ